MAITIEGDIQQQVDHFQYLGAMITADGKCEADIRARLGMAKGVLTELKHIMEKQSYHDIYQITTIKVLGLASWNLWSRSMVLWKMGTTEIAEF